MKNKVFKKILFMIFVFLLSAPSFAFDWGIFAHYEEDHTNFALHKIINDIPIKYMLTEVCADEEEGNYVIKETKEEALKHKLEKELMRKQREKELNRLIEEAFNNWLQDTKNMILEEDRAEEFDDIMPILSKHVLLQRVNDRKKADISFFFTTWSGMAMNCGRQASACFIFSKPRQIILVNPYSKEELMTRITNKTYKTIAALTHEIGHYYALTDQYKDTGLDSVIYSTFNRMIKKDAVMGAKRTEMLSCDDVDGFINLVDLTLYLETGEFSPRASQEGGWASFCNGKKNRKGQYYKEEFYREGKLLNKPYYTRKGVKYHYDENGKVKRHTEATEWWTLESH